MKKVFWSIQKRNLFLAFLFIVSFLSSCKNDKLLPETNAVSTLKVENIVPDLLSEYKNSEKQFVFEEQKIYSSNKKSHITIYLCSYDKNLIDDFKKNSHFELSILKKDKLKEFTSHSNGKNDGSISNSESMDFWVELGEKYSEDPQSALILSKVFENKKAKFKPSYANFDYYVDNDSDIGVYRLPANNSDSDVNCEFFLKHGWLGAWQHQITINLIENWQTFDFNPASAYKVRVNVRHNWNNYNVFNN
ncbi:hypothetical protein EGI22_01855 [Lacihabitans sp. LS3-19]|uniref:hypothetical protein n=1 Tax=Lacihabitans sp. LS3-19 TaxID=2487335 RepID=UPI0020CF4C42|nr:hypothetical protein [Lacihabitans sp. LS3-19]MCP9766634.1 hypothetical protein [Lacihabitans sp. LS3-19]